VLVVCCAPIESTQFSSVARGDIVPRWRIVTSTHAPAAARPAGRLNEGKHATVNSTQTVALREEEEEDGSGGRRRGKHTAEVMEEEVEEEEEAEGQNV